MYVFNPISGADRGVQTTSVCGRIYPFNFYKWCQGKKDRKHDIKNLNDGCDLHLIFTNGVKGKPKELRYHLFSQLE